MIAREVRALPERPNLTGLDPFELLRACGALLVRGDVDRALRCARHTADPAALERRILRQSFPCEAAAVPEAVQDDLVRAARRAGGTELAELRGRLREPTAALIAALIDAHAVAHDTHRRALVDWMEALQPLGAPPWTLTDRATARLAQLREASARTPRPTDLDQPRSQPLRERLEAMLDAPALEPRNQAAAALLGWPEPAPRARAAEAYLRGAAELAPSPALAAAVLELGRERVLQGLRDPATRPRLIPLLPSDPDRLEELRLGHADPRVRLHAHRLLRSCETREAYLEATLRLLGDPIDDVRRAAIRTVGHARFAPAVPALIALLTDRSPQVRRAAAEALVHVGEPSRGALRHALAGARPDRRGIYAEVLERLDSDA